jgi:hypothetical protein
MASMGPTPVRNLERVRACRAGYGMRWLRNAGGIVTFSPSNLGRH